MNTRCPPAAAARPELVTATGQTRPVLTGPWTTTSARIPTRPAISVFTNPLRGQQHDPRPLREPRCHPTRQGCGSLRPEPGVRQRTSLTASALRDEVIDLGFEDASWFDPDLLEEPLDLQADDPVNTGPGKKAEEQHPRVIR
jgi:hypothetical protein